MDNEKQERTGVKKKKYLSRYINNLRKVERLERKLDILKDRLTSIRSPSCSGMPRGGSPYTVEDMIVDVADLPGSRASGQRDEILSVRSWTISIPWLILSMLRS